MQTVIPAVASSTATLDERLIRNQTQLEANNPHSVTTPIKGVAHEPPIIHESASADDSGYEVINASMASINLADLSKCIFLAKR